jgi:hypothetical protein
MSHGLYNDMGSSSITDEGNAVHSVGANCLLMHKALDLQVRDNVFIGNARHEVMRYAHTPRNAVALKGNTIVRPGKTPRMRFSTDGRSGNALLCDGAQSFVLEPHAPALDPEQFTLEAWVKLDRYSSGKDTRRWIAGKNAHEWTQGHYALIVSRDRVSGCLNIGGGKENLFGVSAATARLELNRWHHLALTYEGKTARVYVDGKPDGERAIGRKRVAGKGPFAIGRRPDGFARVAFSGLIDGVRLYRRALAPNEIQAHAAGKTAAKAKANRVKAWDFDKPAGASDKVSELIDAVRRRAGVNGTAARESGRKEARGR